jgi:voltage-gated potassium channel
VIVERGGFGRRLAKPMLALALVICIGGVGYSLLESDWSLLDSLYMSVITVTTVGLREVRTLDAPGRIFTIFLIIFGVGAFTYFATSMANYLIAGELKGYLGQRKMRNKIEQLANHFIICGYGRMGIEVARDFKRERQPIVIVDQSEESVARAAAKGYLALLGDAGDDNVLRQAGIERARGLITVIDDDATNVLVVLTARGLSEKLFIVARANAETTESKLIMAGANRVLWPYGLGGRRMAQMAIRPNVVEFLELVMHDEELELCLEELPIAIESRLDGVAIGPARLREATGANIVAIRQRTGKLLVSPSPDTTLQAGDIVVALGTRAQLNRLQEMGH